MIIVDIETTGLDNQKHAIADIGSICLIEDFIKKAFVIGSEISLELRIPNDAEIDSKALEINGYTIEQLRNPSRIYPEKAIEEFITFTKQVRDRTIAGENPRFDLDFLRAPAKKHGVKFPFGYRTIDLHTLAYCHHLRNSMPIPIVNNRTALNLDEILSCVGLPPEPKPHRGLQGAKLEAESFSRIIFGRPLFPEYSDFKIPEYMLI